MKSVRQIQFQASAINLPKNIGKSLRTQVVLGSPGAGCQDVGICRVIPADVRSLLRCPSVTAWISITAANKMRFSFLQQSIPDNMMHRHFGWGLFQVLEPFEVPFFLQHYLKTEKRHIQPGIYPAFARADRIIVDF